MKPIKIEEVLRATHGELKTLYPTPSTLNPIKGVSIDSRTIKPGELFVALKGNKHDGHSFVKQAFDKGAAAAIVSQLPITNYRLPLIIVKDTIKALGDLAAWYRSLFSLPIIGITGSNGKTTTKDLTAKCLETHYHVLKNKESFNSLTGVPISLFNLEDTHEVGVLEIGTNRIGEIKRLSNIVMPKFGVITNIGPTHLESFKTIERVLKEKLELLGVAEVPILNADDPWLSQNRIPGAFTFGIKKGNLRAQITKSTNGTRFKVNGVQFELPLFGIYQVYNALAALAVAVQLKLKLKDLSKAIKEIRPATHRDQVIEISDIKVIDSTYNANPASMKLAIQELKKYRGSRKVAILGDMLELGEKAYDFHISVGKHLKEVDVLIGLGDLAKGYVDGSKAPQKFHFYKISPLIKELKHIIKKGDVILVKGSRAMTMERIVKQITSPHCLNNQELPIGGVGFLISSPEAHRDCP